MAEMTLQEQIQLLKEVVEEAKTLGAKVNSFTVDVMKNAEEQLAAGDNTPLPAARWKAHETQKKINRRQAALAGVGLGMYGSVSSGVGSTEATEVFEDADLSISYAEAYVTDGKIIFSDESGLSWTQNTDLEEDRFYVVEIKSDSDGNRSLASARMAAAGDVNNYSVTGDGEEMHVAQFAATGQSIKFPIVDPTFYVQPNIREFGNIIFSQARMKPQKVLVSGPQGTGKTSVIEQLAAEHGYGFFRMSCGMVESPREWFGQNTVKEGALEFRPSAFIQAVETPSTVILLDEFNRLHSTLQNSLYNILDDFGAAWLDDIERNVRVANDIIFFATCNIGMAHTGTFQIDAAMEDRFAYHLKMDYLPEVDEIRTLMRKTGVQQQLAEQMVKAANMIRRQVYSDGSAISVPISFRQLESAANLIVSGMKPMDAFRFTVLPKFSDDGGTESEQAEVLKILQGMFGI